MGRKTLLFMTVCLVQCLFVAAQEAKIVSPGIRLPSATEDSIRAVVLDYADGFYSGDMTRVERAIHPDLNKAFPRYIARSGRTAPSYTTYSQLIELTRAGLGKVDDTARHLQVTILAIEAGIANAKVTSSGFNDYLQVARVDGQWRILNVLWNGGPQNLVRLKDFDQEKERSRVKSTVATYLAGVTGADADRLKNSIDGEFNRILLNTIPANGRTMITRQRYESLVENGYAGIGKQDESTRDNHAEVIDMMDGMALAKATTAGNAEYLQLYWNGSEWKILNSILFQRPDVLLAEFLPAIAGDPMPDFTLPVYGGGKFSLSENKGKNILLFFPRGWLGRSWCSICPYQYLELAGLEKAENLRKKYNLEIVFVLPYNEKMVAEWLDKFPETMKTFETVKHPAANTSTIQKEYGAWMNNHFPKTFDIQKETLPTTFPVLIDADQKLSKQLKIYTGYWDGITSDQNISAAYIIDKEGILRWKYISQMTEDRPPTGLILDFIRKMK